MRFAVAAMVAAMVTVDGRAYSSYALKKVKQTRHKLERIHGRGLVGLYNEHNEFRPHRLSKGLKNNKLGASISIDGIDGTFELDSWIVNFLGALDGFTYSEVRGEETPSQIVSSQDIQSLRMLQTLDTSSIMQDRTQEPTNGSSGSSRSQLI